MMKSISAPLALLASVGSAHAQGNQSQGNQAPGNPAPSVAPPAMQAAAPGLAAYTDEVLFGEVWKRPGLSPRDRSLVTVSALVAAGRAPQLTGHLGRALDNGVTPLEIAGLITHLAFYCGWPVAVSAVGVADEVFQKRGVDRAALAAAVARARTTLLPVPASDPARAAAIERSIGPVAPAFAGLTNGVLFNDLWRRPDLAPRDRSLVTIAALIAAGDAQQLAFHITRGMENGLTRDELAEAVTHLAFYAGWPKAMAALPFLASASEPIKITRAGAEPRPGPAATFTGTVRVDTPFRGDGAARIGGASVTFEPGARTAWHRHPLGQTLIVTAGRGWVQRDGGPLEEIGPGDTAWIPPGVKHWHGATARQGMTHIAITEALDGKTVEWLEQVSDSQYPAQ